MLGSPSGNKDVSSTEVSSVNGRVVQIEVQFFDNEGAVRALQALKDKYGPSDPNPSSGGVFMYNKTSTINGEEVVIAVKSSGWYEYQKEVPLTLTYSYKKLVEIAESRKKQAEEAERARRAKTDN